MSNNQWHERRAAVFPRGMGALYPVYAQRAKNAEIWDEEGNRYLDFAAGIAVVNTGHSHPKIVQAVKDQVDAFSHTCIMITPYSGAVELAEKLVELAPVDDGRAIFVSTGAEAVENAVKIARAHTGRPGVVAFTGGFHGRTNLCMGLTGKVMPYKAGFGPFTPEIYHVPFPADYLGVSSEDSLAALDELFRTDLEPERIAAIIIEPVQGEGGFYPAPAGFLQRLREICDRHGIVFICDEIQTGFGRTGRMFACEHDDVRPDLVTLAKGMAGGYPLAAVVGRGDIMNAANPGGLGGTYAGSPVACAAGLAVLDVMDEENLCERAVQVGDRIVAHLGKLREAHPDRVGDIRGRGAMIALELVTDGDAGKPDAGLISALVTGCLAEGVMVISCGVRGNVIRFLPPLTMPLEQVDEGMDVFSRVFAQQVAASG